MTMREEFEAWHKSLPPANYDAFHAWCAAYRAGQEAMRERAAYVADNDRMGPLSISEQIRALPIE